MLIIDGYNFLYQKKEYFNKEDLILAVQKYAFNYGKKTCLVFDGAWDYQGEHDTKNLEIKYVKDADQTIKDLVLKNQNSLVITSDHEIICFARRHGSKAVPCHRFSLYFSDESQELKTNALISQSEVDEWLRLFTEKE